MGRSINVKANPLLDASSAALFLWRFPPGPTDLAECRQPNASGLRWQLDDLQVRLQHFHQL